MRPFAVTKWSAWLVSKESPCLSGCKPSYTKSATVSCLTPCSRLLTDSTQKTLGLQKPSVPNEMGRWNKQRCRNVSMWSSGECNGVHEPLDTTNRNSSLCHQMNNIVQYRATTFSSQFVVVYQGWQCVDGGNTLKYYIIGNFCLQTSIGAKWGWCCIRVWLHFAKSWFR